jgi:hypothetical protein
MSLQLHLQDHMKYGEPKAHEEEEKIPQKKNKKEV